MMRQRMITAAGLMLLTAGVMGGCGNKDATVEMPANTPPPTPASPGAAPTFGQASGMGFSTGDAAHSDGQGSGLMGYHGTGAMGTSGAITDKHAVPEPPKSTTEPVLPPA